MRILILDDDAPFARMLAQQLERLMPDSLVASVSTADAAREAVRSAAEPFDVLLLDIRLEEADVDGVALMEELKKVSPTSDAIVFTGYDVEEGLQAFDAGAYRYLTKPFDTRELVRILKVLQRERETRRERDWLTILADVAAQMQGTDDVHALADIIVRGGLRFGFRRARLRLFEHAGQETTGDPELVGVSQAGEPHVEGFEGLRAPLSRLLYSQRAIEAGRPLCFKGRELGPGGHDEFYAAKGVTPPKGHWFKIPLLSGGRAVGALTLDNDAEERYFGEDVIQQFTQVLALFGSQAADALERARLREAERRQADKARLLSDIGREVTVAAARGDLDTLLDEARRQVGRMMDVTSFMVVLRDLETETLDFRRQYEEGVLFDRHWRKAGAGLSGRVIDTGSPLLVADTTAYCEREGIRHYGRPAMCWLGVPLRVEDRTVGALVVQSYQSRTAYGEREKHLLGLVADQVAGAIYLAYRLERQAELARQEAALQQLKKTMPELIRESEELFWHAVLTTITHREGNSFNRALLLWYDEAGEHLLGRMAIGQLSRAEARRAWERDRAAGHTLKDYFAAPRQVWAKPSPLQTLVVGARWPVGGENSPCLRLRANGQRLYCRSDALRGCLPDEVLFPPDLLDDETTYECALLPVKSKGGVLGLLLVDNAFDSEPLRPGDLDSLERVLEAAVEVWSQTAERRKVQRLGERYEKVLAIERNLIARAAGQKLKASLEELCREARALSDADAVVIYPYHASSGSYDLDSVAHVGLQKPDEFQAKTKNKPRQQGVTFTVLQSGTLVVPEVSRSTLSFGGRRLAEHDFLQREGIEALIAAPMRHALTGEPLGVLYLDYRSPRRFEEQDIALAEHLAAVAAAAISAQREVEQQAQGRAAAERSEQQRRRDMQILSAIQAQALASDTDQEKMVRAILQNAAELFDRTVKVTLALLEWEGEGEQRREVRRDFHLTPQGRLQSKPFAREEGLIGKALGTELVESAPCVERDTIVCAVRRGAQPVGAIQLKKRLRNAFFTAVEVEVVERLATVAALALDNMRARAHLEELSRTIGAVADPSGLRETLEKVVASARKVAPDIDCITLWHEDAETKELISGAEVDVTTPQHKGSNASTNRIVRRIMNRHKPLFAPVVEREPSLQGDFTQDEGIVSAAAFPLRFGPDQRAFGALFFNYRKAHEFLAAERRLFETFANAAATAVHSARTADLTERQRRRLETALKVTTEAGASLDRDTVLRGILTVLRDAFCRSPEDHTAPYIMLYDERDRVLELPEVAKEFYQPDQPEYQYRMRLPLDDQDEREGREKRRIGITVRVARRALRENRIVVKNVPDVQKDDDYVEASSKTRSELCAGLVSGERLLGALVIKSARVAAFDQDDERLFEMAAHQVAIMLDRLERAARVERDASVAGAIAWAADVVHDLKSPVGMIQNYLKWLGDEKALSEKGKEWLDKANLNMSHIADMVKEVDFNRSALGYFSLPEMLRTNVQTWFSDRPVEVDFDWDASEPWIVYGHPQHAWRAIRQLLRNSLEAMEKAASSRRQITLKLLPLANGQIELQITDTGPGILPEVRWRLFREPFSTKGTAGKGHGLGLLLAQWLIESMNGSIYLYPQEPGCGARFGIRFSSIIS